MQCNQGFGLNTPFSESKGIEVHLQILEKNTEIAFMQCKPCIDRQAKSPNSQLEGLLEILIVSKR